MLTESMSSGTGVRDQRPVCPLFSRLHIVAAFANQVRGTRSEVLVELEFHAALWPGRSTKRPRLISAPYASEARMSS